MDLILISLRLCIFSVLFQEQKFSKTHTAFLHLRYLNLNIDIIDTPEDTGWVTRFVNLLELAPLLEELELHVSDSIVDHHRNFIYFDV